MRLVETLPCSKHGHPAWVPSRLLAWVDFYKVIAPYNSQQGGLDHVLITKICNYYGIDFIDAFEMLTTILEIVKERDARDKGV
jgi:hypothetical protein